MTTIAIMQPTYLPWLGYFALMARVDRFVLLDSVQFARRSWQQRNRIKLGDAEAMLTLPVHKKGLREQTIAEVRIVSESDPYLRHLRTVHQAYQRSPYFEPYYGALEEILLRRPSRLLELQLALINWQREVFEIDSELLLSSRLRARGRKAELLAAVCSELRADHYVSAPGSFAYLNQSEAFAERGIQVSYHDYEHPHYPQLGSAFVAQLSALDLIFNCGPSSREILLSGNRPLTRVPTDPSGSRDNAGRSAPDSAEDPA